MPGKEIRREMSDKVNRQEHYSLILLAGGKSSRMGSNKAELLYKGQTFTKTLLEKVKKLGIEQICISGFQEEGIETVWDIYQNIGPLGGLHACMKHVKTSYCLVIPVDVPQIPVEVLEELLEYHEDMADRSLPVLLKHGEQRENLIGIYPVQMAGFIEERIKSRKLSVHGMLDAWGNVCFEVKVPEWQIENINTKEAYEELLKMSQEETEC